MKQPILSNGSSATKLTLNILYSRKDRAGNCYFAFQAFNPVNGKEACGRISGGESNIRGAEFHLRGRWPETGEDRWYVILTEKPVRVWERTTKDWPHAGCNPKELLSFIRARVDN